MSSWLRAPFDSLRINRVDDLETTLILLAIGLAVGQLAVHAHRSRREVSRGRDELASMRRMAERVASGANDQELIEVVTTELTTLMDLIGCRFEVAETVRRCPSSSGPAGSRAPTAGSTPTASSHFHPSASASPSWGAGTRWDRSCSTLTP